MSRFVRNALLVLAATAALSAAELGVMVDKQFGKAQTAAFGLNPGAYDSISPGGYALRGAFGIVDLKVVELSVSGAYHPTCERNLVAGGKVQGTFGHSYAAIGLQVDWRLLVNLHLGAEFRQETLRTTLGGATERNDYRRPWLRAGVGFSMPTPVLKPFVRLEVAYATAKESGTASWDSLRKALAPEYQVGLYAGIAF